MVTTDTEAYFRTTNNALSCIEHELRLLNREPAEIRSVLDFGCGYGRVYRGLAAYFPTAKLTACDLMEPAAKFCGETFGGDWAQSDEDLSVVLPRQYDLVWLGSVFTHLPSHRWLTLLSFLSRVTSSGGIVIFTAHGHAAIRVIEMGILKRNPYIIPAPQFEAMKAELPQKGFCFVASAAASVKHLRGRGMGVTEGEYGFSFTSEPWIRGLVSAIPEWRFCNYSAAGWGGNHDVVTLERDRS